MSVVQEITDQVLASLNTFDFSPAFPGGYTGSKSVLLVHAWPFDLIDNMLAETGGQMTRPIISVISVDARNYHRSLGNVSTVNAPANRTRFATRVEGNFLVSCWADQFMGGGDTVEKLGGLVAGWAFLNQSSLPSYRQLRASASHESFEDRPQVWRYDSTLTGYAMLTYDV
jgi:hypothetical protein